MVNIEDIQLWPNYQQKTAVDWQSIEYSQLNTAKQIEPNKYSRLNTVR